MDERHPIDKARPLTRRAASKIQTIEKAKASARKLFDRDGYAGATLRDIATDAGMSTGAITANYADKAALYRAAFGHDPITPEQGRLAMTALGSIVCEANLLGTVSPENMNAGMKVWNDFTREENAPCNT